VCVCGVVCVRCVCGVCVVWCLCVVCVCVVCVYVCVIRCNNNLYTYNELADGSQN
jgi:hypothetical protein